MTFKKILLFSILFCFSVFCFSKQQEWYLTGELASYPKQLYVTAVGEGNTREEAISYAQRNIASQLEVSIESEQEYLARYMSSSQGDFSSSFQKNKMKSSVSQELKAIQVVKEVFENDKYFVFCVLDKEKYLSNLDVEINQLINQIKDFKSNFEFSVKKDRNVGTVFPEIDQSFETLERIYDKMLFYNSIADSKYELQEDISISEEINLIKKILSETFLEVKSGDNQKAVIGYPLKQDIVIQLSYQSEALINVPLKIIHNDEILRTISDFMGRAKFNIDALPSSNEQTEIKVLIDKSKIPSIIKDILLPEITVTYLPRKNKIPIELSILYKGKERNTIEKKIASALTGFGYVLKNNAVAKIEASVSIQEKNRIESLDGHVFMTTVEVQLILIDDAKKIGSTTLRATGMSNQNEQDSLGNAFKKLKIKRKKIAKLMMNL